MTIPKASPQRPEDENLGVAANMAYGLQHVLTMYGGIIAPPLIIGPAAGLSPAERRELVALLTSLPTHMSFVLIEHDLDIALRVVERVTILHNGRLLKHGTPDEIENDAEVQAIYMGGGRHGGGHAA